MHLDEKIHGLGKKNINIAQTNFIGDIFGLRSPANQEIFWPKVLRVVPLSSWHASFVFYSNTRWCECDAILSFYRLIV